MLGVQEVLAIVVIVLGLALLLAPVIGIPRAFKRIKTATPSTGAVVLSFGGAVLAVVAGLSRRLSWFYCLLALGMNVTWLWAAVQANRRAAARGAAATGRDGPSGE